MKITYISGDATSPIGDGNKFIVHVCNDCGAWGAGFVLAISNRWSEPEKRFREAQLSLGDVQITSVAKDIWVCNMVAQTGLISKNNPKPLNLDALQDCLMKVEIAASANMASIHMPRIGTGLAGGKWDEIEPIIKKSFRRKVIVYDFETAKRR